VELHVCARSNGSEDSGGGKVRYGQDFDKGSEDLGEAR
jgi:hypothetical protein